MSVPLFTKHLSGEECSLFRSHYFPSVLADHFDFHLRILTAGSNSGGGNRRHSTSYGAATRLRRQRKSRLIIISARRPTYFQRGAGQPACRTTNRSTIVHRHRHRHRHRLGTQVGGYWSAGPTTNLSLKDREGRDPASPGPARCSSHAAAHDIWDFQGQ